MELLVIEKDFIHKNKYSRPGDPLIEIRGLVYHWTGGLPGTSARAQVEYFDKYAVQSTRYASAHFVIGTQGEIIQAVPTDEIAYHCGAKAADYRMLAVTEGLAPMANSYNIGIEMCHCNEIGSFTKATLKSAKLLGAYLCNLHNLDVNRRVVRHYDLTGKTCPKFFVRRDWEWQEFKRNINTIKRGLT